MESSTRVQLSFAVASFGRSGSVWLSKVLSSHPDVLALHEGVMQQIYPRAWHEAGLAETENWLMTLSQMHGTQVGWSAYTAIGDLNSFGGFHRSEPWANDVFTFDGRAVLDSVPKLEKRLLLREPIVALESKRRMLNPLRDIYANTALPYLRRVVAMNPGPLEAFLTEAEADAEFAFFFMLCVHLHWVLTLPYAAVRLEDLSSSVDRLRDWAGALTGVEYEIDLLAARMRTPENQLLRGQEGYVPEATAILGKWDARYRGVFVATCGGWSAKHGYAEPLPVAEAFPRLAGVSTVPIPVG